jgi:hypothetical protein
MTPLAPVLVSLTSESMLEVARERVRDRVQEMPSRSLATVFLAVFPGE